MDKVIGWAFGEGCCRSRGRSSASADASRSSSCRRRPSPAAPCSWPSARRRRSRSSSPTTAASRSAASSATAPATVYTHPPHPASCRTDDPQVRLYLRLTGVLLVGGASAALRVAEGARAVPGRDARGARRTGCWPRPATRCSSSARRGSSTGCSRSPSSTTATAARAPVHGLVAGLRAAAHDTVVALPVDVPLDDARARSVRSARREPSRRARVPLPGAYPRRSAPRARVARRRRASCRSAASTRRRSRSRKPCSSTPTRPPRSPSSSG